MFPHLGAKYCWAGNQMFPQLDRELHFGFQRNGSLVVARCDDDSKTEPSPTITLTLTRTLTRTPTPTLTLTLTLSLTRCEDDRKTLQELLERGEKNGVKNLRIIEQERHGKMHGRCTADARQMHGRCTADTTCGLGCTPWSLP